MSIGQLRPAGTSLAALVEDRVALVGRGRLGVDAHQRLGAAEADQQPGAVGEPELEAVVGVERVVRTTGWPAIDAGACCAQLDQQPVLERRVGGAVGVDVGAQVERRAGDVVQVLRPPSRPASGPPRARG